MNRRVFRSLSDDEIRDIAKKSLGDKDVAAQLVELAKAVTARRGPVPAPWSAFSKAQLRLLMTGPLPDAVGKVVSDRLKVMRSVLPGDDIDEPGFWISTSAIARWLRSGARVLRVTNRAADALDEVTLDRLRRGMEPIRWFDVPFPGSEHFEEPYMFQFGDVYTFASGSGRFLSERLDYVQWDRDRVHGTGIWFEAGFPDVVTRGWLNEAMIECRRMAIEGKASLQYLVSKFAYLFLTGNMLAALNNEHKIEVFRKKRDQKEDRSFHMHPRPSFIELDESGLLTWKTTCMGLEGAERDYPENRASPRLHHVADHEANVWVKAEHVRPGEIPNGEKMGVESPLMRVVRSRSGGPRGDDLKVETSDVVVKGGILVKGGGK